MSRVRNIAMQVLEGRESLFTTDFEHNKEALRQVAIVRSKQLRNKLAGYITSYMKAKMEGQTGEAKES